MLLFALLIIVITVVLKPFASEPFFQIITLLVSALVKSVLLLAGFFVGAKLYHTLAIQKPHVSNKEYPATGKYKILTVLGLLVLLLMILWVCLFVFDTYRSIPPNVVVM